jgi:hypothetical protein
MNINNKFEIGEIVYLVTDPEQFPRLVFGFLVSENSLLYRLACGVVTSDHYSMEISKEKNYNI